MTAPGAPARADDRSPAGLADPGPVIDWVLGVAVVGVVCAMIRAISFTPAERTQGLAQKILYLHVPSGMGAYVAFGVMSLMSIIYLWIRDDRADQLAEAAGEVALAMFTIVVVSGPLWAKPEWGAWWAWWEPQLVLSLFLWFTAIGYQVVRTTFDDVSMRARYSAVLGVMSALLIPFIHMSAYMFSRRIHPDHIFLKPGPASAPREMTITFWFSVLAFCMLSAAMIRARYRLGLHRAALDALEGDA